MGQESPIIVRDGSLEIDSPATAINPGTPGSPWTESSNTLTYNSPVPLRWIKLEYDDGTSIVTYGPFVPNGSPWTIELDRNGSKNDMVMAPDPGNVANSAVLTSVTSYTKWAKGKHVWKSRGGPPINTVRISINGESVPGSPFTMASSSKRTAIRLLFADGTTAA